MILDDTQYFRPTLLDLPTLTLFFRFGIILLFLVLPVSSGGNDVCTISPLGEGMDDTENVGRFYIFP